jgi:diguanylate cyclase (GGDEF)-like protein
MTLYRQLLFTIIALFTASFLASVTISTMNLRSFLVEQLATHAQDTATSLGLSLSPYMSSNDTAVMNAMIDAIFDRGYFKAINLTTVDGNRLIERSNSAANTDVPSWFVDLIDLPLPAAEATVMSGWKPAATISVAVHPGRAYQELWKNFRTTLLLFLLTAIAAVLMGMAAVHLLLKPLKRIEEQARAICRQDFVTQKMLPRTRELRRVVEAMNRLSGKVNEIFAEQASLTDRLRIESYQDELTGLGNRRFFNRRFQALLEPREEPSAGVVLLLELHQLARINTRSGYQAGDELLRKTAQLLDHRLSGFRNWFSSRISGAGFGIVIEHIDDREAETLADSLCSDLLQLDTENPVETANSATIGLTAWKTGDSMADVLSGADMARRSAEATGGNAWRRYQPPDKPGEHAPAIPHWPSCLEEIIDTANVALHAQPVLLFGLTGDELLHREVFMRLPDGAGGFLNAGPFLGRAEQSGLACALDKLAVEKLLDYLNANPADPLRYALNLTAASLHNASFVDWLCSRLAAESGIARRVAIEFPERAVLRNIQVTRSVVERLAGLGSDCGIDHFGHGFNSFGYLRSIQVRYLKVEGGYSRNVHVDIDNQFFLKTLADTAHSVDIRIFAAAVESDAELAAIRKLNVDGAQGYWLGKPEPL